MMAMLRTLLAERFELAVHREKRSLPAYILVVTKTTPLLRRANYNVHTKIKSGGTPYALLFEHVSMAQLAQQLGPPMTSRPVIDKTGIEGSFDFTLDLARYILDPATGTPVMNGIGMVDTEGATLRAARDQLGLELKAERAPFEVLVVDHVEKHPSAN